MANADNTFVTYDEAVRADTARILFMGPRRSGKSSIERVVFHKMAPHETLFDLESTSSVDIHLIANVILLFIHPSKYN